MAQNSRDVQSGHEYELVRPTDFYFDPNSNWQNSLNLSMRYNCGHWRKHPPTPIDVFVSHGHVKDSSFASVRMKGERIFGVRGGLFRFISSLNSRLISFTKIISDRERFSAWHAVWQTDVSSHLVVRGGTRSQINYCRKCGWLMYGTDRARFDLLAGQFEPQDLQLCQLGLLVRTTVASRMRELHLNGIRYDPVRVVEEPLDGFPEEIELHKTPTTLGRSERFGGP